MSVRRKIERLKERERERESAQRSVCCDISSAYDELLLRAKLLSLFSVEWIFI